MARVVVMSLLLLGFHQDGGDAASEKARLHEGLATAAVGVGEQLIKSKAWDEARAFLELIRAKSDARAEALDKLIAKTEKQASGLKWDAKSSDAIKSFGAERAKGFFAYAKSWKEKDAEAARWTEAEAEILDDLLDYVKAYARLSQIRAHYDLPKTRFDWKLSVPAYWHAEYKRLNPKDGKELEGNDGYSIEGKNSGEHSITSRGESLTNLIEGIIHGPFQRTMAFNPFLVRTGFGQSNGNRAGSVIDVLSGLVSSDSSVAPLAIPSNNSTNVPPAGFDDNVAVIQDRSMRDLGYPISLTFFDNTKQPTEVKAKLLEAFKEVEIYLSTPEQPALPKKYPTNKNSILLIPKSKLKENTEYNVWVSYNLLGLPTTKQWRFKTGR